MARAKSYVGQVMLSADRELPFAFADLSRVPRTAAMLCRSYATAGDARAAVARLLAAGVPGGAVRVVMGEPPCDARGRHGGCAASTDADRDAVTTFRGGIATQRVTSRRALAALLGEAGVDPEAVAANVRAVHAGRVLVLVDATAAAAVTGALDSG
jgi:hypothetical protein